MTAYMPRLVWAGVLAGLLGTVVASAQEPGGFIVGRGLPRVGGDIPSLAMTVELGTTFVG